MILVNFWAPSCPPCRKEIPDLNALHERFESQGLVILSISDEEESAIRLFLAERKIIYPVLLDPGHIVKDLFRVRGIPSTFVYNRDGQLAATAVDQLTMQGFVEVLAQAGLR